MAPEFEWIEEHGSKKNRQWVDALSRTCVVNLLHRASLQRGLIAAVGGGSGDRSASCSPFCSFVTGSAKFTGSGGAVVAFPRDDAAINSIMCLCKKEGWTMVRAEIAGPQ